MIKNILKTLIVISCVLPNVNKGEQSSPQTNYDHIIMTYNILSYSGYTSEDNAREDDLRTVIHYVSPDILVVEEVHNTVGFNNFLTDVLNYFEEDLYTGATFSDQPNTDMDIALYYKPNDFEFISTRVVDVTSQWGHRDAIEFVMKHLETDIEFGLYGVHLKAGSDSDDESDRESEATKLRDYLNTLDSNLHFLVLGDFNLYHSTEGAFKRLTESQDDNDGQLFDPANRIGNWHDNSQFADVHTQSSRGNFGGQWYGGMDDRFDFIFSSAAIIDFTDLNYMADSYTPLGNDGQHLNKAINSGNNLVVPDSIADALVEASDHIPVYLTLQFVGRPESSYRVVINEIMQNPVVVSDSYGEWFEIYNSDTVAIDLRRWTIRDNGNDNHVITSEDPLIINPGEYTVLARNGDSLSNGGINALYDYSGFQLSNTEDEIIILDETGAEVDRVQYSKALNFPLKEGASMALLDAALDNNNGSNWSSSTTPYGDGNNMGTPGEPNYDVSIDSYPILPKNFELFQNYPNPFNPVTTIDFSLPRSGKIKLTIYDVLGREIDHLLDVRLEAGRHRVIWDARNFPTGVYLYRLQYGESAKTRKLLLLK